MGQVGTVKKLPAEIRDEINRLLAGHVTLDQIVAHLKALDVEVSRSALGRYKREIDKVGERIKRSREISSVFVDKLGAAPEDRKGRLILELLQTVVFDLLVPAEEGAEVALDPKDVMQLAKAMRDLVGAEKTSADREIMIRRELAEATRKRLDAVTADVEGGRQPLTLDTLRQVFREAYGVNA